MKAIQLRLRFMNSQPFYEHTALFYFIIKKSMVAARSQGLFRWRKFTLSPTVVYTNWSLSSMCWLISGAISILSCSRLTRSRQTMSQLRQRREKNCDGVGFPTYSDGQRPICYFALRTQKWCLGFPSVGHLPNGILTRYYF